MDNFDQNKTLNKHKQARTVRKILEVYFQVVSEHLLGRTLSVTKVLPRNSRPFAVPTAVGHTKEH